jgi:hypothetical protein
MRVRLPGVCLTLCAACATDIARDVSVEPTPMAGVVDFVLKDRNLMYGLTVMTCNGRAVWTISNQGLGLPPGRISYGVTPEGFVSRVGPEPLKPGCYEVVVSGPSHVRFRLGEDGKLISPAV